MFVYNLYALFHSPLFVDKAVLSVCIVKCVQKVGAPVSSYSIAEITF